MRDWYLTPSGSQVQLSFDGATRHPDRDMAQHWVSILGPDGKTEDRICIGLLSPGLLYAALSQHFDIPPDAALTKAVKRAALLAVDQLETLERDEYNNALVELNTTAVVELLKPPPAADVAIRRYLARLLYSEYSRNTLNTIVEVGEDEALILGARQVDLTRNAELLAAEGLLSIEAGLAFPLLLKPSATLVRQVERYGAAKEDVLAVEDYGASLRAYPVLGSHTDGLLHEYARYQIALTGTELVSVFRAVAPIIEAVLKGLLRSHGSTREHAALGPAIADLQARSLGGQSILSQLSYVVKFTRDLTMHGNELPLAVLRIACENTFALVPQLAALFPRNSAA